MLLSPAAVVFCLIVEASALSGLQDFSNETDDEGFIAGKDRQYILTGTSFSMDGCIHRVKVSAEAQGGVFAIDVWRHHRQSRFTLASSVELTPMVRTRTIFLLDASPPVQFQNGDHIGFHLVTGGGDFQVGWTSASSGLTMSSIITQKGDTPVTTFPGTSWSELPTTWPIMFLSTSRADFCGGVTTSANSSPKPPVATTSSSFPEGISSITSTNNIESSSASSVSSAMAASSSSSRIVSGLFTISDTSTDTASDPANMLPDFPGDSPMPPGDNPLPAGAIAGILVAVLVVVLLVTFSILIVVCHLKFRKARRRTWKVHLTDRVNQQITMNSLAASCSPLVQEEEPRCATVVMQPNPAYSTAFSDIATPSARPCAPATCAPTYANSHAVPNLMYRPRPQATSNGYASLQTKPRQLPTDEDDYTYCSVSTADVNMYDYINQ